MYSEALQREGAPVLSLHTIGDVVTVVNQLGCSGDATPCNGPSSDPSSDPRSDRAVLCRGKEASLQDLQDQWRIGTGVAPERYCT